MQEVYCSTDGKVTIIYGKNGDGKTTLHQLFQWIFYNKVNFNKTTSDKMYNLEFESEKNYGEVFSVIGNIEFVHNDEEYSLKREWIYKKGLDISSKMGEDLSLLKKDDDYNWNRLNNPTEIIEELLPSGLSEYFFFDGESMIADLRVKGKESANKLRQALYTIFDLNLLDRANFYIGDTNLRTTVLGSLYISKATINSDNEIKKLGAEIENAQNIITKREEQKNENEKELIQKSEFIQNISEQIGNIKPKKDYEKKRNELQKRQDVFFNSLKNAQTSFGEEVASTFPKILLSKIVNDAKQKINLKVDKSTLPPGVNPTLINTLLNMETCICGNKICEDNKKQLNEYFNLLPPLSYKGVYDTFSKTAINWQNEYDREKLERHIKQYIDNKEQAKHCDFEIHEIDKTLKDYSKELQTLVDDRIIAENRIKELQREITELGTELYKYNTYLKKKMKDFDDITAKDISNKKTNTKIEIMKAVKEYFYQKLQEDSIRYSDGLKNEIEFLLNKMLTSKRNVAVSSDFLIRVFDSYNDESKSEGQFAVVSFAYIGGIFNLLKAEDMLSIKEYPLILDGPFSKLDPDNRQNVINTIPEFAPQVILFSKDDLQNYFSADSIGNIWTIESNDEKNVACVKEGFLWK